MMLNTTKELLSGGLGWEYKESFSNDNYCVFFASIENVKNNNSNDSLRCSHFETVSYDTLIDKNTEKNCIAVSNNSCDNNTENYCFCCLLKAHV